MSNSTSHFPMKRRVAERQRDLRAHTAAAVQSFVSGAREVNNLDPEVKENRIFQPVLYIPSFSMSSFDLLVLSFLIRGVEKIKEYTSYCYSMHYSINNQFTLPPCQIKPLSLLLDSLRYF